VRIVYDEPKRLKNIETHGLDFADLDPEFFPTALISPAKLARFKAIGPFSDDIIAVIFSTLGSEAVSIIFDAPGQPQGKEGL
jgi:uncharacterized protein